MKITRRRIRIQTILLIVNLTILALPLGSIFFLKLLEDEQVRQTEVDLVAQGASIASISRYILQSNAQQKKNDLLQTGNPISARDESLLPLTPKRLYLSRDQIFPERPDSEEPHIQASPLFISAGKQISPLLKRIQKTTLAGLRVLDSNGIVIASSRGELGKSFANLNEVRRALKGESVSILRHRSSEQRVYTLLSTSRDTGLRVFVCLPIIIETKVVGAVLLSRTPKSVKKMLYDKKGNVIAAAAVLLLIVLLLTVLTSLTITRPLKELIRQSKNVAAGKIFQKPDLNRPGVVEIQQLSKALSEMTERIEFRSNYIQNFALNVSHEFKSPLTAITGAIELLQNYYDDMTVEKREHFIQNIAQDTHRLERLVSRLLELARADVFEPGEEKTDLIEILKTQQAHYQKSDLDIELQHHNQPFYLPIGRETLETITSNLFQNSLQHGASRVCVNLNDNNHATICFADNGAGISEANAKHIFTPFFTTNRKKGGTGLGLQIIQSLLKAHKADIAHIPSVEGAIFEIQFLNETVG